MKWSRSFHWAGRCSMFDMMSLTSTAERERKQTCESRSLATVTNEHVLLIFIRRCCYTSRPDERRKTSTGLEYLLKSNLRRIRVNLRDLDVDHADILLIIVLLCSLQIAQTHVTPISSSKMIFGILCRDEFSWKKSSSRSRFLHFAIVVIGEDKLGRMCA